MARVTITLPDDLPAALDAELGPVPEAERPAAATWVGGRRPGPGSAG
jgi:hypothetical protein